MRRFGIFLSTEKYQDYPDTPHCHADSDSLKNALVEKCDYPLENMLQIKLSPGCGKGPAEILQEINILLDRSDDGDSILFFYAGHGEVINQKSYLILPDTRRIDTESSALALADVSYYLSKNKRINFRIFDCCHSGENIRDTGIEFDSTEFIKSVLADGGDASVTFSSCAIHEKSYWDDDIKQGVFTSSFVNAIRELPADTPVHIEKIKIDVCARVQKWAEDRSKTQTPTLSMHMTGNMPFAHTKKSAAPTSSAPSVPTLAFEERLQRAREVEVVDEAFYPTLQLIATKLTTQLSLKIGGMDFYTLNPTVQPPAKCDKIPSSIEERIALKMQSEKTMHEMEVIRTKRPITSLQMLMNAQPIYDVDYIVSQRSNMPDCFVEGKISGDKIVPQASVFIYICPLQASVTFICGHLFNVAFNSAKQNAKVYITSTENFSIASLRNETYIELVDVTLKSFKDDLHAEVLARLKVIENEIEKLA
jgi:hypothetical protein